MAKGVRHIEIRQWFTRDTIQKGKFDLIHMPGVDIPADKLTYQAGQHLSFVAKSSVFLCYSLPEHNNILTAAI